MHKPTLQDATPNSLAEVMDFGSGEALWNPSELGAILGHQLDSRLQFDLTQFDQSVAGDFDETLGSVEGPPIRTFRDLFAHPSPPARLLDLTRRFAKACRSRQHGPLPDEIATVLYLASIVAAMIRCGQQISRLDDEAMRYALDWALEEPWLDESIRDLLSQGRQAVEPN